MSDPDEPPAAEMAEPVRPLLLRVHRAPRIGRFILTGGAVGLLVGIVVTLAERPGDQVLRAVVSVTVLTALVGGLVGGLLALAADRRRGSRAP